MGDFLGPGLQIIDKLVDKHFDKIPNSAMRGDTYHPKNLDPRKLRKKSKSRSRNISKDDDNNDDTDRGAVVPVASSNHDHAPYPDSESDTTEDDYQRRDPRTTRDPYNSQPRSYYSPPSPDQYAFPPPSVQTADRRSRDVSTPRSRRPVAISRRSNSLQPSTRRYYDYDEADYSAPPRSETTMTYKKRASSTESRRRRKEDHKTKAENLFSMSDKGLGASALGIVVGGLAAKQAQLATGHGKGRNEEGNSLVILLGAAIGGLGANALEKKWEDKRESKGDKGDKDKDKDRSSRGGGSKGRDRERNRRSGAYYHGGHDEDYYDNSHDGGYDGGYD